eukprot:3718381-Rhodomonas_salina.3
MLPAATAGRVTPGMAFASILAILPSAGDASNPREGAARTRRQGQISNDVTNRWTCVCGTPHPSR